MNVFFTTLFPLFLLVAVSNTAHAQTLTSVTFQRCAKGGSTSSISRLELAPRRFSSPLSQFNIRVTGIPQAATLHQFAIVASGKNGRFQTEKILKSVSFRECSARQNMQCANRRGTTIEATVLIEPVTFTTTQAIRLDYEAIAANGTRVACVGTSTLS